MKFERFTDVHAFEHAFRLLALSEEDRKNNRVHTEVYCKKLFSLTIYRIPKVLSAVFFLGCNNLFLGEGIGKRVGSTNYGLLLVYLLFYAIEHQYSLLSQEKQEEFLRQIADPEYIEMLGMTSLDTQSLMGHVLDDIMAMRENREVTFYVSKVDRLETDIPLFDITFEGKSDFLRWFANESQLHAPCERQYRVLKHYSQKLGLSLDRYSGLKDIIDNMILFYEHNPSIRNHAENIYNCLELKKSEVERSFYNLEKESNDSPQHLWQQLYHHWQYEIEYYGMNDVVVEGEAGESMLLGEGVKQKLVLLAEQLGCQKINSADDALSILCLSSASTVEEFRSRWRQLSNHYQMIFRSYKRDILPSEAYSELNNSELEQILELLNSLKTNNEEFSTMCVKSTPLSYLIYIDLLISSIEHVYQRVNKPLLDWFGIFDESIRMLKTYLRAIGKESWAEKIHSHFELQQQIANAFSQQFLAYIYLYENYTFPRERARENVLDQKELLEALKFFGYALTEWAELTEEKIRKQYLRLSLIYHPDKNPGQETTELFLQLTQAKDLLLREKGNGVSILSKDVGDVFQDSDAQSDSEAAPLRSGWANSSSSVSSPLANNQQVVEKREGGKPLAIQQKKQYFKELKGKCTRYLAVHSWAVYFIRQGYGGIVQFFAPLRYKKIMLVLDFYKVLEDQEKKEESMVDSSTTILIKQALQQLKEKVAAAVEVHKGDAIEPSFRSNSLN